MVFSSLLFLYGFLPVSLLLYFIFKDIRIRNIILVILSVLFYAWGEPLWVILLLFTTFVNYLFGRMIGEGKGTKYSKLGLVLSVVVTLSLLAAFKYLNFLLQSVGFITGMSMPLVAIGLPIGISFYSFHILTYTIDLYNKKVSVQKSYINFLLYVSLFPQLVAGPILRYSDVEKQIMERTVDMEKLSSGIVRFACGLAKKVIIANAAGKLAAQVLGGDLSALPAGDALFGIIMYTIQIYFDFSGYSDMALGLGKMFGFHYPENFNYPYISRSITEFWRRWHISLSTFFRDYVYIPLGGNRKRQILNMFIVWALTGLWHGASWNFVLWGLYYFVFLVVEKYVVFKLPKKLNVVIGAIYTLPVVILGWALFYYTDTSQLFAYLKALFGGNGLGFSGPNSLTLWLENIPVLILGAVCSVPYITNMVKKLNDKVRLPLSYAYTFAIMIICTQALVGQTYNPFIYFRF